MHNQQESDGEIDDPLYECWYPYFLHNTVYIKTHKKKNRKAEINFNHMWKQASIKKRESLSKL